MALLPSLEDNIKCGNSLIGNDFDQQLNFDLSDDDRIKITALIGMGKMVFRIFLRMAGLMW
jgi:hypothetical protein